MSPETKRKKVIIAVTKSNFGGAQRYVFDIATNLPKEKFDVVVICGGKGELVNKLASSGIRTIKLPYMERDISIGSELRTLFDLTKIFQMEKPSIVHLNSPKMGGLGALAARIVHVPKIIYTAHGWTFFEDRPAWQNVLIRFFSWLTTFFSHKVIVITKKDLNAAEKFPLSHNKIIYLPNGILPINFLDRVAARERVAGDYINTKSKSYWIASIAELHRNKNLNKAIEEVVAAKKDGLDIFYVIFGEGEERRNLEKIIGNESAEQYIKLAGFDSDANKILKAFDCLLMPSKKEGLPYAILEAGLAGLTVIASDVGGVPDIIDNEKNGYLIESKTDISKVLKEAMQRPLGGNLKETIEKNFSFSTFLEKILKIYN